jgi:large subunit ribosomal protein L35
LTKKTKKQKRNLTQTGLVHKSDLNSVKTLLGMK